MAVDLDSMAENAEKIWEESILPSLGEFIEIHALSPMFEPNCRLQSIYSARG